MRNYVAGVGNKKIKGKIKSWVYKFAEKNGFVFVLSLICVIVVFALFLINPDAMSASGKFIDFPVFSSITIPLVIGMIANMIEKGILNWMEDTTKLTDDYDYLNELYRCTKNLVSYDNTGTTHEAEVRRRFGTATIKFPVCCDCMIDNLKLTIYDDKEKKYMAPDYVRENFNSLIEAHSSSNIYNNLNIRVDEWYATNDDFIMRTSRTTYFDSMCTNRAMDYKIANGVSVRDKYELGPAITSLSSSVLSNHLGFNAFVISADGKIPFVKRSKDVSTGKRTYGNSVGASLKTKYALDKYGNFDHEHLVKAIKSEIKDELNIDEEKIKTCRIIAAYRDLLEGGKPQLLVYVETKMTKREISIGFKNHKRKKAKEMLYDGEKILWVDEVVISDMSVVPDGLFCKNKFYPMLPSASASVVMLKEYLQQKKLMNNKIGGIHMIHNMKLWEHPFTMISKGLKTFELRLNDEKRQLINVGDTIIFTCPDLENSTLEVRVVELHHFNNFTELYSTLPLDKCGYLPDETASPSDMEQYYPPDRQAQYGVVAIEIELIK